MANDITRLIPTLFGAAQEVSAEPFGAIKAINANFDDKRVAKGDKVTVPVAPTREDEEFTPGMSNPAGADAAADGIDVEITASRKVSWNLTGEQMRTLENGGTSLDWAGQMVAQGMRTLRNRAEKACALAIKSGASRAIGTAGTTPFASNLSALTAAYKVLEDNGAPMSDLQFIGNTDTALNLRNLGIIQQADQAGSDVERRTGQFMRQFGFQINTSAGIASHAAGTGAGYLSNGAKAVGSHQIALDTGTGTVLVGDVVTFAGDPNMYVVNADLTASAIGIGRPGLRRSLADNVAMTVVGSYTPNLAFERNAVAGVMRPPVFPENPTIAQQLVSDQFGMTYLFLDIAGYGMRSWELHLAYGFKVVQREHVAIVLG